MIRLDKYLAQAGIGTRSEIRAYCKAGIVSVDGRVCCDAGCRIDPGRAAVTFREQPVSPPCAENVCYMLNKPEGYLSATADNECDTVLSLLPALDPARFFPIGRLDKDSGGLLLITNDGALSHRLTSPRRHVPKTYEVWISGILSEGALASLRGGTDIGDEKPCLPAEVTVLCIERAYRLSREELGRLPSGTPPVIAASRVQITITEGRYHQVKRMFHANRHEVFSLKRTAIGMLRLDPALKPGESRRLSEKEITDACRQDSISAAADEIK